MAFSLSHTLFCKRIGQLIKVVRNVITDQQVVDAIEDIYKRLGVKEEKEAPVDKEPEAPVVEPKAKPKR